MLKSRLVAPIVAFAAPLLLYGGALVSQYGFGLHPCEMCYWQRWPHQAAILLGLAALLMRRNDKAMRALTLLAALAIAVSGAIGAFHAGVEYGFWEGVRTCASRVVLGLSIVPIGATPAANPSFGVPTRTAHIL